MNTEQVCKFFEDRGYRNYPVESSLKKPDYFFSGKPLEGPDCECNDKPAPFHVHVYEPMASPNGDWRGSITFISFGECSACWTEFEIYSISFEELSEEAVEKAHKALSKMWSAFCESMS